MSGFLIIAFLFFIGSTVGWFIELFFRRFFTAKKWINPGFLVGPYLPLYGFGTVGLYLISNVDLSGINNRVLEIFIIFIIMMVVMTLVEYLAGIVFIKKMKIKLWDYSDRLFNVQGIICPLFTFLWGIVGLAFYFLVYPSLIEILSWLSEHLSSSFFIGIFYGIFIVDIGYSFHLSRRIREFAVENKIIVRYENLKESIRLRLDESKEKFSFIFPFKSKSLRDEVKYFSFNEKKRDDKKKDDD